MGISDAIFPEVDNEVKLNGNFPFGPNFLEFFTPQFSSSDSGPGFYFQEIKYRMAETKTVDIPNVMLDELWNIMHMITEIEPVSSDSEKWDTHGFQFECDVETESIGSNSEESSNLVDAARRLSLMGDSLATKYQHAREDLPGVPTCVDHQLVAEISEYLELKASDINDKYGEYFKGQRPQTLIFESGLLGSVYSMFRSKLENFLGAGQELDKIAMVSHITKGIGDSFRQSSLSTVHFVTALSYHFITERFGSFLLRSGGLSQVVLAPSNADS